jgi:hypothetical protein
VHSESEAEVPVALALQVDLVRIREQFRIAVRHRPGEPDAFTLLELDVVELGVVGEGAAVAGRGAEEAQEFLGGGIQQRVALVAEDLALVGIL